MTASAESAMTAELRRLTAEIKHINDDLVKLNDEFLKLTRGLQTVSRVVECLVGPVPSPDGARKLRIVGDDRPSPCHGEKLMPTPWYPGKLTCPECGTLYPDGTVR